MIMNMAASAFIPVFSLIKENRITTEDVAGQNQKLNVFALHPHLLLIKDPFLKSHFPVSLYVTKIQETYFRRGKKKCSKAKFYHREELLSRSSYVRGDRKNVLFYSATYRIETSKLPA